MPPAQAPPLAGYREAAQSLVSALSDVAIPGWGRVLLDRSTRRAINDAADRTRVTAEPALAAGLAVEEYIRFGCTTACGVVRRLHAEGVHLRGWDDLTAHIALRALQLLPADRTRLDAVTLASTIRRDADRALTARLRPDMTGVERIMFDMALERGLRLGLPAARFSR